MTTTELKTILSNHKLWLNGKKNGVCADLGGVDLSGANLSNANLRYANLRGANLSYANLRCANLSGANLSGANLSNANLRGANLSNANLSNANLRGADLSGADLSDADLSNADLSNANLSGANLSGANLGGADLSGANLRGANLRGANLRYTNLSGANLSNANLQNILINELSAFIPLSCPEEGSFIAFKTAQNHIIKLLIPEDAKRSSATSYKCRASKAKVLEISDELSSIQSDYDNNFVYAVGETIEVDNFDECRWNECSTGIHFFMSKELARQY